MSELSEAGLSKKIERKPLCNVVFASSHNLKKRGGIGNVFYLTLFKLLFQYESNMQKLGVRCFTLVVLSL